VFLVSIVIAYFISTSSIKNIIENDMKSVVHALEKNINYIANKEHITYKDEGFKKMITSIKVGKSGYVYFIDESGTMVVHHKKEGKNYAGHDYIDYIRSHKEGGVYEYTQLQQDKIK
jgi:methyl-accepting chemotaxis protein